MLRLWFRSILQGFKLVKGLVFPIFEASRKSFACLDRSFTKNKFYRTRVINFIATKVLFILVDTCKTHSCYMYYDSQTFIVTRRTIPFVICATCRTGVISTIISVHKFVGLEAWALLGLVYVPIIRIRDISIITTMIKTRWKISELQCHILVNTISYNQNNYSRSNTT